jgi:hypothetical protein
LTAIAEAIALTGFSLPSSGIIVKQDSKGCQEQLEKCPAIASGTFKVPKGLKIR